MPKVGKRKFSYSKKGKRAAATYAKKTGKKVRRARYS
jgi:formylmethanofuran dehydrogenase subunit E